jgi:hypothetical protein
MTSDKFEFEEIPENEAEFAKRGRKSNAPAELVKAIVSLKAGKVLRLTSFTVNPESPKAKTDRAKFSAVIRSAGKLAGRKVAISWTPKGVPQVMISPTK